MSFRKITKKSCCNPCVHHKKNSCYNLCVQFNMSDVPAGAGGEGNIIKMVDNIVREADNLLSALVSVCTKENTDTGIECDGETYFCHSIVLKARSPVFYNLLANGTDKIRIDGVKSNTMELIIKYLYSSKIDVNQENLVDLIVSAYKFELPNLQEKCLSYFKNQLNVNNAIDVLIVSQKMQIEEFKLLALSKISKHRLRFIKEPEFKIKMMNNPEVLFLMYENVCEDPFGDFFSAPSEPGSLWTCICGTTATGNYCAWCSYIKFPSYN